MQGLQAKVICMCKPPIHYLSTSFHTYPYSIVGKGNHSANHIQKLKPRVEQVCRDLGNGPLLRL